MPFKVQVGPPQIAIHQAMTVLVTEPDGQVQWPTDKGLYFFDTRLISAWRVYANGEPWDLLNGGAVSYDAARIFLTNRSFLTEDGAIPAQTLGVRAQPRDRRRACTRTSTSPTTARSRCASTWRSPSARTSPTCSTSRPGATSAAATSTPTGRKPRQTPAHDLPQRRFHARRCRCRSARRRRAPSTPTAGSASRWHCRPAAPGTACLLYELADGEQPVSTRRTAASSTRDAFAPGAGAARDWQQTVLKLRTSNEEFYRFYHQAIDDMAALRLPIEGTDHMVFVPAAGLPWFMAPFGRDSLIVSLQNILVYPEFARGSLDVLGRWQATERDDYRDAEPGKIMHELRYGELAHFKLIPHTPYYGTADATPLYLITLHAAWRATGDHALLEQHLPNAEAALDWIDNYGDRDGDGFQEYQTRSPVGYENMAWKDAGDSMVYPDGSLVRGPKALCELQGYVYDAWLRMAEVFDALGAARPRDAHCATRRRRCSTDSTRRSGTRTAGFYAYMLDGEKRKVLTVASNPGHCCGPASCRPTGRRAWWRG